MTASNSDSHHVNPETERALRDFVRTAISRLAGEWAAHDKFESQPRRRWERGADGAFRERVTRSWIVPQLFRDEWLHSLPRYEACVERLKFDAIVGPHINRLVGTATTATRIEVDQVLRSAIYAMQDDEGGFTYSDERFDRKCQDLTAFFAAKEFAVKLVAPLPYLALPKLPLRLNDELELDHLTDDEVTRCCSVGILRPPSMPDLLVLDPEIAVGLRRTRITPKIIGPDYRGSLSLDAPDTGVFGHRSLRDDLVIDDVLLALRLHKHNRLRFAGCASWIDSTWLSGASFYVLGQWPYLGGHKLSDAEVPQLLELWQLLESGSARFAFALHRFNLACDRNLLDDRIVDLVIAAEALFLSDTDSENRGELSYRLALRAAKFIEHSRYAGMDLYKLMRRAYRVRSAIVHGSHHRKVGLPDDPAANLSKFADEIEELLRLALRKVLALKEDAKKLRNGKYWDELVFSEPKQ
jgi:hypothetical protein